MEDDVDAQEQDDLVVKTSALMHVFVVFKSSTAVGQAIRRARVINVNLSMRRLTYRRVDSHKRKEIPLLDVLTLEKPPDDTNRLYILFSRLYRRKHKSLGFTFVNAKEREMFYEAAFSLLDHVSPTLRTAGSRKPSAKPSKAWKPKRLTRNSVSGHGVAAAASSTGRGPQLTDSGVLSVALNAVKGTSLFSRKGSGASSPTPDRHANDDVPGAEAVDGDPSTRQSLAPEMLGSALQGRGSSPPPKSNSLRRSSESLDLLGALEGGYGSDGGDGDDGDSASVSVGAVVGGGGEDGDGGGVGAARTESDDVLEPPLRDEDDSGLKPNLVDELSLFCGTWNVGNEFPGRDLSQWIPCGAFDLYAIGVQESDFAKAQKKADKQIRQAGKAKKKATKKAARKQSRASSPVHSDVEDGEPFPTIIVPEEGSHGRRDQDGTTTPPPGATNSAASAPPPRKGLRKGLRRGVKGLGAKAQKLVRRGNNKATTAPFSESFEGPIKDGPTGNPFGTSSKPGSKPSSGGDGASSGGSGGSAIKKRGFRSRRARKASAAAAAAAAASGNGDPSDSPSEVEYRGYLTRLQHELAQTEDWQYQIVLWSVALKENRPITTDGSRCYRDAFGASTIVEAVLEHFIRDMPNGADDLKDMRTFFSLSFSNVLSSRKDCSELMHCLRLLSMCRLEPEHMVAVAEFVAGFRDNSPVKHEWTSKYHLPHRAQVKDSVLSDMLYDDDSEEYASGEEGSSDEKDASNTVASSATASSAINRSAMLQVAGGGGKGHTTIQATRASDILVGTLARLVQLLQPPPLQRDEDALAQLMQALPWHTMLYSHSGVGMGGLAMQQRRNRSHSMFASDGEVSTSVGKSRKGSKGRGLTSSRSTESLPKCSPVPPLKRRHDSDKALDPVAEAGIADDDDEEVFQMTSRMSILPTSSAFTLVDSDQVDVMPGDADEARAGAKGAGVRASCSPAEDRLRRLRVDWDKVMDTEATNPQRTLFSAPQLFVPTEDADADSEKDGLVDMVANLGAIPEIEPGTEVEDWFAILRAHMDAEEGGSYIEVATASLWQIKIAVFVRRSLWHRICNVSVDTVTTGVGNVIRNKGGAAVSLQFDETRMCFISSHLAAHQEYVDRRNEDFRLISSHLENGRKGWKVIHDFEHVFWMGDLNYRIDLPAERVDALTRVQDWDQMYQADQLRREMAAGNVFQGFHELQPRFPPTFRYERLSLQQKLEAWGFSGLDDLAASGEHATKSEIAQLRSLRERKKISQADFERRVWVMLSAPRPEQKKSGRKERSMVREASAATLAVAGSAMAAAVQENVNLMYGVRHLGVPVPAAPANTPTLFRPYSDLRIPSWTDRVLWHSLAPLTDNVVPVNFTCSPGLVTSDHAPVMAVFRIHVHQRYRPHPWQPKPAGTFFLLSGLFVVFDGLLDRVISTFPDHSVALSFEAPFVLPGTPAYAPAQNRGLTTAPLVPGSACVVSVVHDRRYLRNRFLYVSATTREKANVGKAVIPLNSAFSGEPVPFRVPIFGKRAMYTLCGFLHGLTY